MLSHDCTASILAFYCIAVSCFLTNPESKTRHEYSLLSTLAAAMDITMVTTMRTRMTMKDPEPICARHTNHNGQNDQGENGSERPCVRARARARARRYLFPLLPEGRRVQERDHTERREAAEDDDD